MSLNCLPKNLPTPLEGPERRDSGFRRAVAPPPSEEANVPPHIPGLPTPAELQIAAQHRLTPLAPNVLVPRQRIITNAPRPFLPPQSVRRAFISQMQQDVPKPARIWPWLIVAFVLSAAGVTFGWFGLRR